MVTLDVKDVSVPKEILMLSSNIVAVRPESFSPEILEQFSSVGVPIPEKQPTWAPGGLNVLFTARLRNYDFNVQQHLVLISPDEVRA
jgi:hypothetical protein